MLISSIVSASVISYVLAGVGLLLIVVVGLFFYAKEIRPVMQAQRLATREKQAIDSIQMAAIDLTKILRSLQALALKNADDVIELVDKVEEIRPYIRLIPKVGAVLDSSANSAR